MNIFERAFSNVSNNVQRILEDPLPMITTVALTYVLGPQGAGFQASTAAAMSQAAVRAANGGNMEDIALSMATAYAGAKIGTEIGNYAKVVDPNLTNTLKQVIASSSGSAAVTALRGGSFENVLQSSVSGAVNGYVASALKEQGFTNVDQRLVSNAASAATNAILKGRSVSDALAQSVTATVIDAAIQGQVDQLNKNNELGQSLATQAEKLAKEADTFFKENFAPNKINVQRDVDTSASYLNSAIGAYNNTLKSMDHDLGQYNRFAAIATQDPSNVEAVTLANNYAKTYAERVEYLEKIKPNLDYRIADYDKISNYYDTVADKYKTEYVAPLSNINTEYENLVAQTTDLSKSLADNVIKYQEELKLGSNDLIEQIGDEAVAEALKTLPPLGGSSSSNPVYDYGDAEPEPTQGNLPGGVQVADAGAGTVSDSGSSPLPVNIGGVPIFADTKGADTVTPPFGYDLMPMAMADERPAGSYYDETQNAWFMPNQDTAQLQQDLLTPPETVTPPNVSAPADAVIPPDVFEEEQTQTGGLPPIVDTAPPEVTSNLPPAEVATEEPPVNNVPVETGLGGLPSTNVDEVPTGTTGGLSGVSPSSPVYDYGDADSGLGSTEVGGGTSGGANVPTEEIPTVEITAPRLPSDAVLPPEEPITPPTTPAPTAPTAPVIKPIITPVSPPAPTAPTMPVATQTNAPLSALDLTPKFLDTNPRFLETKVVSGSQPKMQELRQLYESMTPELASTMADRGYENPQYMAGGGSANSSYDINNFADSLNPTSKNLGFVKPYAANLLPAAPLMQNQMKLNPLRHLHESLISRQRTAGGLASGGLPEKYAAATPAGHKPEFITGLTGYYASGKGTGQSDDIDAMLHDGDYVADADLVAALGDGSSKAGAEALEKFRRQIPHQEHAQGGAAVAAKIADGEYVFPASFVTAIGQGDNKAGAKILDKMRESIRAHKRSAPTTKIPPKAKSPLEYLKMVKG
jgi:hypothetical protein